MEKQTNMRKIGVMALIGTGLLFIAYTSRKNRLMTIKEVSFEFGYGNDNTLVLKLIEDGDLKAVTKNGVQFIRRSELDRYFSTRSNTGGLL